MRNSVKKTLSLVVSLAMLISCFSSGQLTVSAADGITAKFDGWFETAYAEWLPVKEAGFYEAYVKSSSDSTYEILDDELIRQYDTYVRADAVGLEAGSCDMKIVAFDSEGGEEIASVEKTGITVDAYDRNGSAFSSNSGYYSEGGIGAYNNDGTLKSGAKVFYVTADTAATITTDVITSSKGSTTSYTGLQAIITAYQKGYDSTPVAFRFVGTVTADDVDGFDSSPEGIQIKGKSENTAMNMTFEGIGNDAAVSGFGFLVRYAGNVEFRNFAILNCMDDGISLDTTNENIWVHNMDFFYGQVGTDSDQAKGDGTVDVKGDSQYITISYNHFWDSGKSSLCGMKSETGNNYITYHHNWFDHSDSRHPRVRSMAVHIYNNYFDGNAKYGSASAIGAQLFVEQNFFRSCKYPVLIGGQGHEGGTTLSGEIGAPIKMYANIMSGTYSYTDYSSSTDDFDGYTVSSRSATIPSTVTNADETYTYDNFDTENPEDLSVDESSIDSAADIPAIVMAEAGRCNGGDIFYEFDDDTEDTNSSVITDLRSLIDNYTTSLVAVGGTVSSACDESADPSAATGVDGCTDYTDREEDQADEAAEAAAGYSSDNDDDDDDDDTDAATETTTTSSSDYDLKLVGSDICSETTTLTATASYTGSGSSSETNAFTVYASSDKYVTINGDQIRLGGEGTVDGTSSTRVIAVTLSKAGTITVDAAYPTLSSNTTGTGDDRYIAVSDGSSELTTKAISYGESGTLTYTASSAGTYYIYSTGSNLYVTLVGVRYSSDSGDAATESTTESTTEVSTESTTEAETEAAAYDLKLAASDISDTELTSAQAYTGSGTSSEENAFTIYASAEKTVEIGDGVIKLGGAGSFTDGMPDYRVIQVTLTKSGTITATAISTSKTAARILNITDGSSTTTLAAPISTSSAATKTTDTLSAGTYYIYSANGGINVSLIGVIYSDEEDSSESTTEYVDDGNANETTKETSEETSEEETDDDTETTTQATEGTLVWNKTTGENTLGVSFSGNSWNDADDYPITYGDLTLTAAVKMESSTRFAFTTAASGKLTLILYSTANNPTIKVDGVSYSLTSDTALRSDGYGYILEISGLEAGTHTVTKGSVTYLYYASAALSSVSGDVDGDGDLDVLDAAIVLKIASGILSEENYSNADCDGSDGITVLDAVWILNHLTSSDSDDTTESTTEADNTTETTTESSSAVYSSGFTWLYSSDGETYPDGLTITGLSTSSSHSASQDISFSDGTKFSSELKVASGAVITVNAGVAGTITLYIVRNKNNTTGTADVTINGESSTDLSYSANDNTSAVVSTITVSANDVVTISPTGEALLGKIVYTAS